MSIITSIIQAVNPTSQTLPFCTGEITLGGVGGFGCGLGISGWGVSGTGTGASSNTAWSQAAANAGTPGTPTISGAGRVPPSLTDPIAGSVAKVTYDGHSLYTAEIFEENYLIAFESMTCYFHVYLSTILTTVFGSSTSTYTSASDMVLTPAVVSGFCVPNVNSFAETDPTTWNASDVISLAVTQPPDPPMTGGESSYTTAVYIVAYSCIDGYVPPLNATVGGFPP